VVRILKRPQKNIFGHNPSPVPKRQDRGRFAGSISESSAANQSLARHRKYTKELEYMAKAYLKIDIEMGKENEAKTALKKITGVKNADFVTGAHDLLATVEGKNYEEIVTKTLPEIRKVKGIKKTTTDFVFEWA
jgi:DNA-binding Lrp family transcriptional regulator